MAKRSIRPQRRPEHLPTTAGVQRRSRAVGAMSRTAIVHYKTGWSAVYLHHSVDGGKQWFDKEYASRTSPIGPSFIVIKVNFAADLLFVLKDAQPGSEDWDNPAPACHTVSNDRKNYHIIDSGTFVLANGQLSRFSTESAVARDDLGGDIPESVLRPGRKRLGLFVDIDRTLYGGNVLGEFVEFWERRLALSGAVLVFNTGRSVESVCRLMAEEPLLPVPTAAVCRVGTRVVWFRARGQWLPHSSEGPQEDTDWIRVLEDVPDWDFNAVTLGCAALLSCPEMSASISGSPGCDRFVVSLRVRTEKVLEARRKLEDVLKGKSVKFAISGYGEKRYLDIINKEAGKLGGMRYVVEKLGNGFSREMTVMAGDSGNDLDALDHDGPEKGIVVGNAHKELAQFWRDLVLKAPKQTRVVMTVNHFAMGIVEGLHALELV